MRLSIDVQLDYHAADHADLLLQIEVAALPDQRIESASLTLAGDVPFTRVAGHDGLGERIWLALQGRFAAEYRAVVAVTRPLADLAALPRTPFAALPGEVVQYLMGSRYCPADLGHAFVDDAFGTLRGGALVLAMRDWIHRHFTYTPGASTAATTAADSFLSRRGVCRDYAHVMIALCRVSGIPARMASVYAPGVEPPDFHAVAEVYLGGAWHLVDPTRMADESAMARIAVGRDAADVAFLTSYEPVALTAQSVAVTALR